MADHEQRTDERSAAGSPAAEAPVDEAAAPTAGEAAGADAAGDAEGAAVEHDLEELAAKARERDEYLALAQRTQADFENFRKRMAREQAQAVERGAAKLAKELLPALDHLDVALKAAATASTGTGEDVLKGFALVRDELAAGLARAGIERFSPEGQSFDPNEHEAMAAQPAEGAEPGTVLEVYQAGYRTEGGVLRPARVVVAA